MLYCISKSSVDMSENKSDGKSNNAFNEKKNGPKPVKKRQNLKGKVSENPANMWVQPSKHGRSSRNLLQALKNWELLVQNMLCDLQELVTKFLHKITVMNNPKEKMKWNKSFAIKPYHQTNQIF